MENFSSLFSQHLRAGAFCAIFTLGIAPSISLAGPGHAHGKADMELSLQGASLSGVFKTPMDSLLGFEHAPKTDNQKRSVEQLKTRLSDPTRFFQPTEAAQCSVQSVDFQSALFAGKVSGGHSDLEYRFVFTCANPEALRGLDAVVFGQYPRLHELRVELVTAKGQRSVTLRKRNRVLSLP
jgi:hypothetical protein